MTIAFQFGPLWLHLKPQDSTSQKFRVSKSEHKGAGGIAISSQGGDWIGGRSQPAVSLLFVAERRPSIQDVIRVSEDSSANFSVSHTSVLRSASEEVWLELLANGLTFDLHGLAPGIAGPKPEFVTGGSAFANLDEFEDISLVPGPHVASGAHLLPVLRSMAGLAADLSQIDGCEAVIWQAARTNSSAVQFCSQVKRWLEGGVFPGLTLASLQLAPDAGLQTVGFSLFTGQEIRIEPELTENRQEAAKIALRLMDELFDKPPVGSLCKFAGPHGEPLTIEASPNRRFVRVRRGN